MFKTILTLFAFIFSIQQLSAQAIENAFSIGGTLEETISSSVYDSSRNLIIVGSFQANINIPSSNKTSRELVSKGRSDGFVCKYNSRNELLWCFAIGGIGIDAIRDVAVSANGDIYICGSFQNTVDFNPGKMTNEKTATNTNIFFARYDSNGNYISCTHISGSGASEANNIAISKSGIYISGQINNTVYFNPVSSFVNVIRADEKDYFIAKYSLNGDILWAKKIEMNFNFSTNEIITDNNDNLYIAGYLQGFVNFDTNSGYEVVLENQDAYLAKYSSSGNFTWVKTFGGTGIDKISDIKFHDNHIYAIGDFNKSFFFPTESGDMAFTNHGFSDIFIVKFDLQGNLKKTAIMGGSGHEEISSIDFDKKHNIYLYGQTRSELIDFDLNNGEYLVNINGISGFVSCYNNDFEIIWANLFPSIFPNEILVDEINSFCITGGFLDPIDLDPGPDSVYFNPLDWQDAFVAKYRPYYTETVFTSFNIEGQISTTIDKTNGVINTIMPYKADLSELYPAYSLSNGATILPIDLSGDYRNSHNFVIYAEDTTIQQEWLITVSNKPNTEAELISFDIPSHSCISAIDRTNKKITVTMNEKCNLSSLEPSIIISDDAQIIPASNVAQDFTSPVNYTVTSQDLSITVEWTVTVVPFSTVGILNFENINLKIYPNPISDHIFIETVEEVKYSIYNSTGQCIQMETKLNKGLNRITLQNIPKGIYTLKIWNPENEIFHRILCK